MTSEAEKKLYYLDAIMIDEELWFSAINLNGLYKMNIYTKEIELVAFFPKERLADTFLHSQILRCGKKLVFVPFQAKYVAVYDMENENIYNLELPKCLNGKWYSKFYTAIQEERYIYIIPCRYGCMVRYDAYEDKLIAFNVFEEDEQHKWKEREAFVFKGACKVGNKLYLAAFATNFIEEYDLQTKQKRYFDLPVEFGGISNLLYEKDVFWIIGRRGTIGKWNKETGEVKLIKIEEDYEEGKQTFFDALFFKDKIYLSGSLTGKIYMYDICRDEVKTLTLVRKQRKLFERFWADYSSMKMFDENTIGILDVWDGKIHLLDFKDNEAESFSLRCGEMKMHSKTVQKQIIRLEETIEENCRAGINLKMLIKALNVKQLENSRNKENTIGRSIFSCLNQERTNVL